VETIDKAAFGPCHHCADLVQFLAFGGFRKSEAANVTWGDCDFTKGEIIVRGDAETGTKNWETRRVPMIPDMCQLLERLRAKRAAEPARERVMKVRECQGAINKACAKLGISRITHHDLRHLFATTCIESGVDIPTVSRWLGHKDGGALAMKVYGHCATSTVRTWQNESPFPPRRRQRTSWNCRKPTLHESKATDGSRLAERFGWWWRKEDYQLTAEALMEKWGTDKLHGARWKNCLERSAWTYELVRRAVSTERMPPFFGLTFSEALFVNQLWKPAEPYASRDASDEIQAKEKEWTPVNSKLQWNLALPDKTVTKGFLDFIHHYRESAGIPKPRPNIGRKNRGIPWRWVEFLDLSDHKIRPLNDAERKSLSEARKQAAKIKQYLFWLCKITGRNGAFIHRATPLAENITFQVILSDREAR